MGATMYSPKSGSSGVFATRMRVILAVSLAITWWFASILPTYGPILQAGFKSRLNEALRKLPTAKVDWHTNENEDRRNTYNTSKVALLIEPRPLPHLVPQILRMISIVPPDWRFLFIGSEESVLSVARAHAVKHQQIVGKLDLMVLPEPWEIDQKEKVYRMLTDLRFYDEFLPGVEWILKYEADSILCANSQGDLNDWLDWQWEGAAGSPDDPISGNGGLSIRRVSAIRRVLGFQARYNDTEPEDEWFGKRISMLSGAKVAAGFDGLLTVEDVRDGGNQLSDAAWKSRESRQKMFKYCPELSMIMNPKLERGELWWAHRAHEPVPPISYSVLE